MNERIKSLAGQAEIKWQHQEDIIYSTMTLEQFEKFSELMVKECAGVVDNWGRWLLYDKLAVKVKQHFGVEE